MIELNWQCITIMISVALICATISGCIRIWCDHLDNDDAGACHRFRMELEAKYTCLIRSYNESAYDIINADTENIRQRKKLARINKELLFKDEQKVETQSEAEVLLHGVSLPTQNQEWPVPSPGTVDSTDQATR